VTGSRNERAGLIVDPRVEALYEALDTARGSVLGDRTLRDLVEELPQLAGRAPAQNLEPVPLRVERDS